VNSKVPVIMQSIRWPNSLFFYFYEIFYVPKCTMHAYRNRRNNFRRANVLCERKTRHWYLCTCRNGNLFGMKFSQTVLARWVFLTHLRACIQRTMENYTVRFTMRQYNFKVWFCYFIDEKLYIRIWLNSESKITRHIPLDVTTS